MRIRVWIFAVLAGWMANALPLLSQSADWMALQRRVTGIYEEHRHAIVRVKAVYEAQEKDPSPEVVIGTGFFISNRGLVITNASIVANANSVSAPVRVWVEHKGVGYAAEVVGSDRPSNVALLRLDTLPPEFGFLHFADSPETPPVGTFLVRLSMPLEFDPTPEMGMVAGYESRFGGSFFPCRFIRTSLPAAPGDGGAAFLDLSGRLIGVQVGALPEVGSTYVLPARAALRIRDDFLFAGEVAYGWIGFEVREESSVRHGKRLVIGEVIKDTPAESVGMMVEDVLLKIGDHSIRDVDDLRNAMFYNRVGQVVVVQVLRGGTEMEFSVRLDRRPSSEPLEVIRPVAPSREAISPVSQRVEEPGLVLPYLRERELTTSSAEEEDSRRNVPVERSN